MFHNAPKVVLCGRRNTFASVWQAQDFADFHRHFAWQVEHCRCVMLRVFANHIVRAASSGDNVQIPWQAWRFVRCDEIDGNFARNIDFEVANFEVHEKTRGKCQF